MTFTVETDIVVGNPVVYDGSTRIKLEFLAGAVDNIAGVIARFYDATTALNRVGDQRTSQVDIMIYAALFLVPSAGSHTFKTTLTPVSSGTTVVNAGALSGGSVNVCPCLDADHGCLMPGFDVSPGLFAPGTQLDYVESSQS